MSTALGQDNTDADNAGLPGGDNPGDNPGEDNPGGENPGEDNPGEDNPGGEPGGDDNPGEDDPGEKNDQVAPDEYADFELADGTEINQEALTSFKELAKEANLTQEQAQKFVSMQQAQQTAQAEELTTTGAEWLTEAKSHFGETKFDEATGVASKGLDYMFGDDAAEVKTILDNTQLGNNVTFIKAFHKIGQMVSEGTFIPGSSGQHTKKTAANILYPNKE